MSHTRLCILYLITELMLPDYQAPCEQQEYHIIHPWAPTLSSVSVDANSHTLIPHTSFASWHLSSLFFLAPWFPCHETADFLVVFQSCSTSSPFPPLGFSLPRWRVKDVQGAEKCVKALAQSSRAGVETGTGKRKKLQRSKGRTFYNCGLLAIKAGLGLAQRVKVLCITALKYQF